MRTIRSVSILSALKVGAVLSALLFAIIGGIMLLFTLLFSGLGLIAGGQDAFAGAGVMSGFGIIGYLIGIVIYAIVGAIGGALNALLYNIVAGMVGGIEINLE
jgi:hypothetical protein